MPHLALTEPDPDSPVALTSVRTEVEAAAIAAALGARGIEARVEGGLLTGFRAEVPAMARIVVRRADLELARAELTAMKSEPLEIDWSQVELSSLEDADESPFETRVRGRRGAATAAFLAIMLAVLIVIVSGILYRGVPYPINLLASVLGLAGLVILAASTLAPSPRGAAETDQSR
ncbi:MAG: hypothetical protein H7Y88_05660 [Phycisphaerales bacterium]|nr:hypothetical protein [Phycisphaerales bacterium]